MDGLTAERPKETKAPATETDFDITGMTCASCVRRVERAIERVPGVSEVAVNLATERARVTALPGPATAKAVIAAVSEAGYEARVAVPAGQEGENAEAARLGRREWYHLLIAAALSAPLVANMLAHVLGLGLMVPGWVQFALATPVQFWLGWRFYVAGWKAARVGAGNMDLLVALGTSAAWGLEHRARGSPRLPAPCPRCISNPRH